MKKTGILHRELGACISGVGHYDQLSIVSCLYGIPKDATVIDLALKRGIPKMIDVLDAIQSEMIIERITVADEMQEHHPELYQYISQMFSSMQIESLPNVQLKEKADLSKVYIRTGENVVFSNILVQAGFSTE